MAFDPTLPATSAPIVSAELRNQFNGLKSLIDLGMVPVGCLMPWLKTFPGTPALPANWVECDGQILNDAESPFDGAPMPNLNGAGGAAQRFLRGDQTSGGMGGSELHDHGMAQGPANLGDGGNINIYTVPISAVTDQASVLPPYFGVVWILRVK